MFRVQHLNIDFRLGLGKRRFTIGVDARVIPLPPERGHPLSLEAVVHRELLGEKLELV